MAIVTGCGPELAVRDLAVLRKAPLYTFNEHELDAYLQWFAGQPLTPLQRVERLARKNIGQPYKIYLLGEYPYELYDADPMFNLAASDCVTLVEQTYAMALAHDWRSFFRILQRLRYQQGHVGLLTRNHFTEADWNPNNAWLFDEVTASVAQGTVQPMHSTIDRATFFARFGLHPNIPVQHFQSEYIPSEKLPMTLPHLHTGDIIEFVRGNRVSQYVGHLGLILHDANGDVTLLHATSPAAREEGLTDYLHHHTNVLGFKVLRIREGGKPRIWAMESTSLPNAIGFGSQLPATRAHRRSESRAEPRISSRSVVAGNPFPYSPEGNEKGFSFQRRIHWGASNRKMLY